MEEQGFRGGYDEKMRRMWLGGEIVVDNLPSSPPSSMSGQINRKSNI